ncbi:hypothetical protein [Vibrio splendidus]|uniref:hypothetical protein n=1 Tax=Vibrio splendidus TaxID=29497 RepID=UPI000D3BD073|nr:hypothetical protein [Vibrio splendidus]MCC4883268.1 hypothetical protein [Vibrio splendidus]PTO69815.1 hypothetical protein CWN96_05510 [Vibrio splendidus]
MDFNKEKEYIWKKLSELGLKLESTNDAIDDLKLTLPDAVKDAVQASKKTSEYRNRALEAKTQAESNSKEIQAIYENFTRLSEEVEEKSDTLDELNLKAKESFKTISSSESKASELFDNSSLLIEKMESLSEEKEELEETINSIVEFQNQSETSATRIKSLLSQTIEKKREIDDLYDEIFGYDKIDEDEDGDEITTHVDGLIEQLNKSYKDIKTQITQLTNDVQTKQESLVERLGEIEQESKESFSNYIDSCKSTYDDTLREIRSLLPQAMTAGLASAYDEKIVKESEEQTKHERTFRIAIFGLFIISLIPFGVNAFRMYEGNDFITIIKDTPFLLSAMLPLYIPILWLAYSANKNYKLSKRLIEEYTHKGVTSKTFEGLSTQINEIEDRDISEELRIKLLFNIVSVNTENPGKLISDYNKSDHPLMDALDKSSKLADAVTKLAKIPGFSAIAKNLDDKANKILSAEATKIEAALPDETDNKAK